MAALTGRKAYAMAQAVLSAAGKDPRNLAPDIFVDTLNFVMRDINEHEPPLGAAIYIAKDISIPLRASERFIRPRLNGGYLTALRILRASYNGTPLTVDAPMDFAGPHDSATDYETGSEPTNIWIEEEHFADMTSPVSEQVWGVWPILTADCTIRATCNMPTPDYDEWGSVFPVARRSHQVIFDLTIGHILGMPDFKDKTLMERWLAKGQAGVRALAAYEQQMIQDSQPVIDTESYSQVD